MEAGKKKQSQKWCSWVFTIMFIVHPVGFDQISISATGTRSDTEHLIPHYWC